MGREGVLFVLALPVLVLGALGVGLLILLQHPFAKLQGKTSWWDKINDDAYWEPVEELL